MSHAMRTGNGFANGRKFTDYFNAAKTDYAGARAIVNGTDHRHEIAAISKRLEAVLLKAKLR